MEALPCRRDLSVVCAQTVGGTNAGHLGCRRIDAAHAGTSPIPEHERPFAPPLAGCGVDDLDDRHPAFAVIDGTEEAEAETRSQPNDRGRLHGPRPAHKLTAPEPSPVHDPIPSVDEADGREGSDDARNDDGHDNQRQSPSIARAPLAPHPRQLLQG